MSLPVREVSGSCSEFGTGDHGPVSVVLGSVDQPQEGWVWQSARRFEVPDTEVQKRKFDYVLALQPGTLEYVYEQWCANMHEWLVALDASPHFAASPRRGMAPRMVRANYYAPQGQEAEATSQEGQKLGNLFGRLRRLLFLPQCPQSAAHKLEREHLLSKLQVGDLDRKELVLRKERVSAQLKEVQAALVAQRTSA